MRLRWVRRKTWRIVAVCSARGDCPLLSFLTRLEGPLASQGRRILKLLDRVAEHGPPRNTQISHQVGDGIWELIQGRIRVLWFFDANRIVILSHGFVKRTQKTPRSEVTRAQENRKLYFEAKKRGHHVFDFDS